MTTTSIILGGIALLYGLFWYWYTGRQKPLTQQEIDNYMSELITRESDDIVLTRIRDFMVSDTGKGFVMVNANAVCTDYKHLPSIVDKAT